jgi:hypothetical protein
MLLPSIVCVNVQMISLAIIEKYLKIQSKLGFTNGGRVQEQG